MVSAVSSRHRITPKATDWTKFKNSIAASGLTYGVDPTNTLAAAEREYVTDDCASGADLWDDDVISELSLASHDNASTVTNRTITPDDSASVISSRTITPDDSASVISSRRITPNDSASIISEEDGGVSVAGSRAPTQMSVLQ